jgi:hypothetical protein
MHPSWFVFRVLRALGVSAVRLCGEVAVGSTSGRSSNIIKQFKIIIERHSDRYVACPPGSQSVVAGEGDTH